MTTDLAFSVMICTRGVYKKLGVAKGTVARWRHDFKINHSKISLDKKVELLERAGYKLIQTMHWSLAVAVKHEQTKAEVDYLNDFPGLTLIGRYAGKSDTIIKAMNKKIVENPAKFKKIYKQFV